MKCSLFHIALIVAGSSAVSLPTRTPVPLTNTTTNTSSLQVDLGYAIYEGTTNITTRLNTWLGIRFAAPPTGDLRWQLPQAPAQNRSQVILANEFASQCPQSSQNQNIPGGGQGIFAGEVASEDCLFLNVYAPTDAKDLPVLVWIHGGGYGQQNNQQPLQAIINANDNGFVAVAIQYRLGAFGWLSSDEVDRFGVVNAGLYDQQFALEWIQQNIELFGGNKSAVTISGESAGGGSVMLHTMAFGGTQGNSLFSQVIAASPYLPEQYSYNSWVPSQSYYSFAKAAGCFNDLPYGNSLSPFKTIFECLVAADTKTLQLASAVVSSQGLYGVWAFLPVTDGTILQQRPSAQLQARQVNGQRMLAGNNANEGPDFTPANISTEAELVTFLEKTFPLFTEADISDILTYYPSTNASVNPSDPLFATNGITGPTALNQSNEATGQQQRADNIYAETTFVCPSYWLVEAFTGEGREAFHYQYSVLPSLHGNDVSGYFGAATPEQAPEFVDAFMHIWGNFIINGNPSLTVDELPSNINASNPITSWPAWSEEAPLQINLNETGGVLEDGMFVEPGLLSNFSLVDAYTWEGGRGFRCDFWRQVGAIVPE